MSDPMPVRSIAVCLAPANGRNRSYSRARQGPDEGFSAGEKEHCDGMIALSRRGSCPRRLINIHECSFARDDIPSL